MKVDQSALDNRMKQLDDPWYTPGDTHLDTSGLSPEYKPKVIEEDNFDVPLVNQRSQSKSGMLHSALLNNPDILEELASKKGITPEENDVIKAYDRNPSFTFHTNGFQVTARWDKNTWACVAVSEEDDSRQLFKLGGHTRFDKDAVMSHANKYLVPKTPWRELSESELLTVARMAPGSPESAIYTYINLALPDIDEDISANPKYQDLCDEIIWFVLENHYPEFDEVARDFMVQKLGRRPLTWNMGKDLFAMYKEHAFESKRRPSLLFNPMAEPEETPESIQDGLDNLSDEALASLRTRTIKLATRR
jgi:hypothetical protein